MKIAELRAASANMAQLAASKISAPVKGSSNKNTAGSNDYLPNNFVPVNAGADSYLRGLFLTAPERFSRNRARHRRATYFVSFA
ncbi:MAG: hypothetical protein WCL08_04520 [Verrucomicrobiota bacterium]